MSAPKTDLETQERRHWGPLVGIALALIASGILAFLITAEGTDEVGNEEQEAIEEIEPVTE